MTKRKSRTEEPWKERLSLLLATVPIFLGLWGMGQRACPMEGVWLLLGLWAVVLMTCFSWESRWQRAALLTVCAAGVLLCFLCKTALAEGIAALGNGIRALLTEKTGYYYPPYENAAYNGLTAAILSVLLGGLTAAAVRMLRGIPQFLCALAVLVLALCGISDGSLWLALYVAGTLLLLVHRASGGGKPMLAALLILALAAAPFAALDGAVQQTDAGQRLTALLHRARYEAAENPMPEGKLQNLGAFEHSQEAALELQMEAWSAAYLRGYVGGVYTAQGWRETEKAAIAKEAELLYALQKNGFFSASQRGAAEAALQNISENRFALRPLGACRAYAYVPYGAELSTLEPRALLTEGCGTGEATEGTLFAVADSYLVQARLAEGEGEQTYIDAEAAYRDWVYTQYLTVPEAAYDLLAAQFPLPTEAMTTAQARAQVLFWVEQTLTYDESTVTAQGDMPYLEYLLTVNPRGYSVQYATLATLLLRCCGVPARYAEGYLLSGAEAEGLEEGAAVVLTQENAHAWTELYLDGVGWIPFDTTPNHKNEIVYELPPDGSTQGGAELPKNNSQEQQTGRQEISMQQQAWEKSGAAWRLPLLWSLLGMLGFVLLLLLLRALALRRGLKKRIRRFSAGEARAASVDCLGYTHTLLQSLGLPERNVPLTQRVEEIAALLGLEDTALVAEALAFAAELCFSDHPVGENHRKRALRIMETVCSVWKKKTKPIRRIYARWVRCNIL
ncbi:MAG: transglutaminase family protein [Faecousia sp.]